MRRSRKRVQPHHLRPQLRLGPGVQDVELEAPDAPDDGSGAQLADDREHRNLPQRDCGPRAAEVDAELPVLHPKVVLGQSVLAQPGQKIWRKQAFLAVEGVPGEPDALLLGELDGAGVIELLAKLRFIDLFRKAHPRRAVDERERHRDVGALLPDRLQHEELVDVGVEEAADDRVELEGVVVDPGGDVGSGHRRPGPSIPAGRTIDPRSSAPTSATASARSRRPRAESRVENGPEHENVLQPFVFEAGM